MQTNNLQQQKVVIDKYSIFLYVINTPQIKTGGYLMSVSTPAPTQNQSNNPHQKF